MKKLHLLAFVSALGCSILVASADLIIPGNGSDGAFNPTNNVEIDLSQAITTNWDSAGNGNGVYDASKWAVIFKYTSVNIPPGVKVTFKNHPSHAPVVWLVQGNVTISGELNLDGQNGTSDAVGALTPAEGGPGGFRGSVIGPAGEGYGLGPGGAAPGWPSEGSYSGVYGNPQIIPLIGGSGSSYNSYHPGKYSGCGGGGAIAIFAAKSITVNGTLSAMGGNIDSTSSASYQNWGSGGAVRLVGATVGGTGDISCQWDTVSAGRIRIETPSLSPTLRTHPETIGVAPGAPPVIWPAADAPKARIVSVDAVTAPADPHAPLVAAADLSIQNSGAVNIVIETTNFPVEGVVQLMINPKFGSRTQLNATLLGGNATTATWRVQTTLPAGFVTLQARATQP